MSTSEFWRIVVPSADPDSGAARLCRHAEQSGWDGAFFGDSQNVVPDPYVSMAVGATVTSSLKLGTGVTVPNTRHPATLGAAAASVQALSGGRVVISMGRGDSAAYQIGEKPMPIATFTSYVERLQGYLSGEVVDAHGYPSRLEWLENTAQPKVPLSIAATGPRVIALGAAKAERITFSAGADPERLQTVIAHARNTAASVGRDPDELRLGAYLSVAATDDLEWGRTLLRGIISIHARFGAMHGQPVDGIGAAHDGTMQMVAVHTEEGHGKVDSPQARALTADFIDRFGIVGEPAYCAERIRELEALGLDHFYILCQGRQSDAAASESLYDGFAEGVLPLLR
ncbi:MAG: LLM class flavin-dependent oxidoreductase [Microbacterium sp.]